MNEYPKCQINITVNILSVSDETSLLTALYNGIMLCLSISGISLKIFSLSSFYQNPANLNFILSLDANNVKNILAINSNKSLKVEEYKEIIGKLELQITNLYDEYKKIMMKKLLNK